jgi:hypothetical protein
MTLDLDYSIAARSPSSQRQLVEAVLAASPSEHETDYIEWKSTVDMSEKEWQFQAARCVLGFANREPELAARWFEGCSYVLFGAEPGNLVGTPHYDVANLDSWISAYVGVTSQGPQWSPSPVVIGAKEVLLITIEPPKQGHRIWTLRRAYSLKVPEPDDRPKYDRGFIFIRRQGRTVQANDDEIEMLTERAQRSTPHSVDLDLVLTPDSKPAYPVVLTQPVFEGWSARKYKHLAPSAPRPEQLPSGVFISKMMTETRSFADFQAEVETYIEDARKAMPNAIKAGAFWRKLGRVHMRLDNPTKRNFTNVLVTVEFEGPEITAYFGYPKGPSMPKPPSRWGDGQLGAFLNHDAYSGLIRDINPPIYHGSIVNEPRCQVSLTLTLARPETTHGLEPFYLFVECESPPKAIEGHWRVLAANADATSGGTISIPVMPNPLDLDEALREPELDDLRVFDQ